MIKLKKVSKFYYSKGMVATGFTKVSLDLNIGEFVAITGESGSGKSTLLNVISGLDSYEEGEMYINGEETSHYREVDYEIYRKKYIGNIFQNFNLVSSYTVYQNVELVLLINGYKKRDIKYKVLDIIKSVGLIKYKNTKVSKLSGGQKQRVAIARCLAKDTPIIIADEPTGNLDSKSAESVLKLLSEISKNKLVIVVTHNYEQIEKYVTRKITMHDGRLIEDLQIKNPNRVENVEASSYKETRVSSKMRLGIRNTFNVIPKFVLMLMVYLFIVFAVAGTYSSFVSAEYESNKETYNNYFSSKDMDKRILLKKQTQEPFTDEDYEKIKSINNIDYILKDDLLYDKDISIYNDNIYLYGNLSSLNTFNKTVDKGRLPQTEEEAILLISNMYESSEEEILDKYFELESVIDNNTGKNYKIKIVGIKYKKSGYEVTTYLSDTLIEKIKQLEYLQTNDNTIFYSGSTYNIYPYNLSSSLISSPNVKKGEAYISIEKTWNCKNNNCINENLEIKSKNIYYQNKLNLKITKEYNEKTINELTGKNYNEYNGAVFINNEDFENLFKSDAYQISVFVKDDKEVGFTENEFKKLGLDTFYLLDGKTEDFIKETIRIVKVIVLSILIVVLFFISYFVIKLILKSRNIYFSTIRMLGSSSKTAKHLLDIELNTITNLAFLIFISLIILVNTNILNFEYIKELSSFLGLKEYIIIYLILFGMSYLTSTRYARKLFKKSSLSAYREEV